VILSANYHDVEFTPYPPPFSARPLLITLTFQKSADSYGGMVFSIPESTDSNHPKDKIKEIQEEIEPK
jgi:hypothetical protein